MMDNKKYKSVLIPIEVYTELREIAEEQDRSIGRQLIRIFKEWKIGTQNQND